MRPIVRTGARYAPGGRHQFQSQVLGLEEAGIISIGRRRLRRDFLIYSMRVNKTLSPTGEERLMGCQ